MSQKHLFDKYLHLLGVERSFPSYQMLCQIIKAHLTKVPFENISKLLYKKQGLNYIPDLPTYLDGIEKYKFGGTCYANNYFLYLLLKDLGYDIKLCGADMKNPDVHIISIVKIDNKEYLIDAGNAAPFFEPLPTFLTEDYIIEFGNEEYILKPKDETGKIKIEQYSAGKLQHWYTTLALERKIEDFRKVIEESYSNDAVFMNAVRITRYSAKWSKVLKNFSFTEIAENEYKTRKIIPAYLSSEIEMNFGMPLIVVNEAIGSIKELKDIYD
jgi:N-hydroxyarylamine O-acetyltransferase